MNVCLAQQPLEHMYNPQAPPYGRYHDPNVMPPMDMYGRYHPGGKTHDSIQAIKMHFRTKILVKCLNVAQNGANALNKKPHLRQHLPEANILTFN